jgi:primosomal protein N' (replication factor Y)
MIARVVVDVPTNQTDRLYDYLVPESFQSMIEAGMRVIIPFGSRKVQGFIIAVKESPSTVKKLKAIEELLDLSPVLTEELVQLGFWLAEDTLCFTVSAFQAMLPAALKAKYKKEIVLTEGSEQNISKSLLPLFSKRNKVFWEELTKTDPDLLPVLQKHIRSGDLEIVYHIKDRTSKKTQTFILPHGTVEGLKESLDGLNKQAVKQKEILNYFIDHPEPVMLRQLLKITGVSRASVKTLVEKGILHENSKEIYRDPYADKPFAETEPLPLTTEQEEAIKPVNTAIDDEQGEAILLHGVTGSGKTEIYLQAIDRVLKKGKEAIVLVPEISLTPQMVERFKGRFGTQVAVLHSGLSRGEKYDEWRKIQRREVNVVVGARSAVFAPFTKIGIIIIDEEHESSYKQEENPRYHARDAAIYRSTYHDCPVVMGSATPALESYARAKKGVYRLASLKERINNRDMPHVDIVDMREEMRDGNRSMFSRALHEKLAERIEKGEQSVLFLNRRGYSTFMICRDCGYVSGCPHCDISLTYHKKNGLLRCHYCDYREPLPNKCPSCESEHFRFFGTGTQKVEEELGKVLPGARIIRMDVDTTSRKGMHEKYLTAFAEKEADILLGTQMIAKGLDFPNVTLVGVLAADSMLHLPDFRSAERTFQLLTQVSGRAGRHELTGEVVVQSYTPDHYSIELASNHDFLSFYMREMQARKQHGYPPFYFLSLITITDAELTKVVAAAEKIASFLKKGLSRQAVVLGPVAPPIPRIKDRYRYHCMVKYKHEPELNGLLNKIIDHYGEPRKKDGLQISIDTNPQMLM